MSFYSFIKEINSFVTKVMQGEEYTMTLLEMNQLRGKTLIQDVFKMLDALKESRPFNETFNIAKRQHLQRKFLNLAMHPNKSPRNEDIEILYDDWEVINIDFTEKDRINMIVDIKFSIIEEAYFRFEINSEGITVLFWDGHYYHKTHHEENDCHNALESMYVLAVDKVTAEAVMDDDDEAIMDDDSCKLTELPFTFRRT